MGKYYAVANGRSKGVFNSWSDCREQVNGYSGAKFKSFATKAEASAFARSGGSSGSGSSGSSYSGGSGSSGGSYSGGRSYSGRSSGHSGYSGRSSGSTSYPSYSNRSYGSSSSSSAPRSKPSNSNTNVVYTDGSSLNNGRRGASAGWGVYWGDNHQNNQSGKVHGEQTNNRGELKAICKAMNQIQSHGGKNFQIKADSKYAIDSITNWGNKWERNGWKTSTGQPVENQDLIKEARDSMKSLRSNGVDVSLEYVPGHSGDAGNDGADKLARSAASE